MGCRDNHYANLKSLKLDETVHICIKKALKDLDGRNTNFSDNFEKLETQGRQEIFLKLRYRMLPIGVKTF